MPLTEEEERTQFYAAIGEGITEWTHVEDMLYLIVQNLLMPADHEKIAAIFYALNTFRNRLEIATAVIRRALAGQQTALEDWEKLTRVLNRKYQRRNELAHHQVYFDSKKPVGRRYKLVAPVLDPDSPVLSGLELPGLHIPELRYRIGIFKVLARRVRTFATTYAPLRAAPP
jgi:hypothetical protein